MTIGVPSRVEGLGARQFVATGAGEGRRAVGKLLCVLQLLSHWLHGKATTLLDSLADRERLGMEAAGT